MKLNEQIKLAAEHYAAFGGNGMDSAAYFAFIKGAEYALKLIANEINDEL
jgi:hypothetical protein